jgi:hypothetical protein
MDKNNIGLRLVLHKIADCVRMSFHPHAIGDPRGRVAVRASSSAAAQCVRRPLPLSTISHCALRADGFSSAQHRNSATTWGAI